MRRRTRIRRCTRILRRIRIRRHTRIWRLKERWFCIDFVSALLHKNLINATTKLIKFLKRINKKYSLEDGDTGFLILEKGDFD